MTTTEELKQEMRELKRQLTEHMILADAALILLIKNISSSNNLYIEKKDLDFMNDLTKNQDEYIQTRRLIEKLRGMQR